MSEYKEFTGTTIDEAKEMAKDYFNTNEIEFELLPPKLLSMFSGKKTFRIKARQAELTDDFYKFKTKAKDELMKIINMMGFEAEIEDKVENKIINLNIISEELEQVKGRGTELIDSMQHILIKILKNENINKTNLSVDLNSQRKNREEFIKTLAERACNSVQKTGRPYILKPLNPRERRLVHIYVEANGFASESIGDSRYKKVKIFKKKESNTDK